MASTVSEAPVGSILRDLAQLLARLLVGGSVLYFHAWAEILTGYQHFFGSRAPWPLVDQIKAGGLPLPVALAVTFSVAAASGAAALIFGLLARLGALILLSLAVVLLLFGQGLMLKELSIAYGAACVVIFLAGPGRISLDALFVAAKASRPVNAPRRFNVRTR